ncbi:MAG: ATP-binding cassette domain-containing protein [Saprospiraceae bacterium]|nr:ATP-binding cassette domain-containing protein [Saprospiraceae bacterium]
MIKVKQLSYKYPSGPLIHFPDFEVKGGESLLVLGESGCGKTTLLHLLAGLLRPTSGKIWIDDKLVSQLNNSQMDQFRGEQIGLVFQKNYFIESLNILNNLIVSPYSNNKDHAVTISKRLGIEEILNRYPKQLSVGQQQRVSIGRAVMNAPMLLLADEPTSALDYRNCKNVINLLLEESVNNNAALVIVTHDDRLKKEVHNNIELFPITNQMN